MPNHEKSEWEDEELLERDPTHILCDKIRNLTRKHPNADVMSVLHSCNHNTDVADLVIGGGADEFKYLVFSEIDDEALMGNNKEGREDVLMRKGKEMCDERTLFLNRIKVGLAIRLKKYMKKYYGL
jgi:hypothetical protein